MIFFDDDMNWFQRLIHEIKCGRHSGFSWCCILWYVLPWKLILKYAKWDEHYTFYHKAMDRRQPKTDTPDIHLKHDNKTGVVTGFEKVMYSDWGMIPCPIHLLRRKRNVVRTCFCPDLVWPTDLRDRLLKEHPELCVK